MEASFFFFGIFLFMMKRNVIGEKTKHQSELVLTLFAIVYVSYVDNDKVCRIA